MGTLHRILAGCAAALLLAGSAAAQDVVRVIAMPPPSEDATAEDSQGLVIEETLRRNWIRARDQALEAGATVIIFEITTPGGLLSVAQRMADDLKILKEQVRLVAYVPRAATSAGAILALACAEIVMAPGSQIGNVIPIEFKDTFTLQEAEGKVKTEVVSLLKSLAQVSGWPELLLEGMADKNLEIGALVDQANGTAEILTRQEFERRYPAQLPPDIRWKLFAREGVAVKLSHEDALYLKLPVRTCADRADLLRSLGLADRALLSEEVIELPRSSPGLFGSGFGWSAATIFSTLLLIGGIAFAVMEFKTPGLGIFGVLSLLCFLGYFFVSTDSGSTIAITTSLLILGFFLVLVEILFIPGLGVAGVAGVVMILGSLYVAGVQPQGDGLLDKLFPDDDLEWERSKLWLAQLLGSALIGLVGAFFIARNLRFVPLLNKTLLMPPVLRPTGVDPYITSEAATPHGKVAVRVGAIGTAETDLRPAGRVRFKEGPVDVVSDGEWIAKGTRVRVLHARGNRVVVAGTGDSA